VQSGGGETVGGEKGGGVKGGAKGGGQKRLLSRTVGWASKKAREPVQKSSKHLPQKWGGWQGTDPLPNGRGYIVDTTQARRKFLPRAWDLVCVGGGWGGGCMCVYVCVCVCV
jgi:hypothetical protein